MGTSYTPRPAGRVRPVFEARGVGRVSPYFQDYVTVAAFVGLGVVLVLALLGVASIFRPAHPHPTKLLTYECGVDPVGSD